MSTDADVYYNIVDISSFKIDALAVVYLRNCMCYCELIFQAALIVVCVKICVNCCVGKN